MKTFLRAALAVVFLLVCRGAQATDVQFDVTSTDAGAYTSYCGQTCNVTLKNKTFSAYEWDGAVFPFTASQEVLNATFGEGKWDLQEFDSFDGTTIKMKAATSIVAGQPYAIRVKQTAENPTFSNVTFASSISTNFIKVTLSNNLEFWGTYFKVYSWQIVGGKSEPATAFSFKSDGTGLGNWRGWPVTFKTGNNTNSDYYGAFAWFFHPTFNSTTPSLSLDIVSSGGESGGGESGGGDEPAPTSLEGKIAARAQITNVPTIYIDLPGIGDQALNDYLYKIRGNDSKAEEAPYRPAKIQVVATSDTSSPDYLESFIEDAIDANGNTNLEIKVRGNSTADAEKRPYRLKFASKKTSTDGQAHKHDLLGKGYAKRNWTLLANVNDKSLLRNALTYHIGQAVGMPFSAGYKFVDLVINNEYRGTYQVSDHCEVDANRINVNEDTGWYVEFQGRNDMCDYPMCFSEGGMMMNINNPEPDDDTDAQQCAAVINPIKDWFLNGWKKAFGNGFTNPATGWRAYNDEETLLKFWIATELTGDYDGLMSVKAYREAEGKLCWGPLWDKDLAFGNWQAMGEPDGMLVAHLEQASCVQDYFSNLTQDPDFMAHAKEFMDNLVSGGIKATLLAKIDEMADVVRETQKLNLDKWGNTPQGAFGYVRGLANYQAYVDQLKQWLSDRIDYVQQQFAILEEAAHTVSGGLTLDASKNQSDNGIVVGLLDKLYNVTLANKSFEKDKWSAISLPFSVNEQTLKSVFGEQYELKELAGIYSNGTTLYFATPANNAINPGMPYLIKPSKAVATNPVFNGVMMAYCQNWDNNHKPYGESVTFGNYTFSANLYLNSLKVDGTDLLIGGDAASFTTPQKVNSWDTSGSVYGLNAYIRKDNGAVNPTISFIAEDAVEEQRKQMNDVPTIYIDTNAPVDADNWGTAAIEVFDQNNMIGGSFTLDNTGLSVKYVGDGSDEKTSYRLKFEKKRALLGSKSGFYKQWVLESNDDDPSMLRNGLTEELGDQIGLGFTPGCQYADLVVNDTYVGTYQLTDRVKVESGRVFVSNKDTDWLLEIASNGEVGANDLYVAGDDTHPNIVIKNPDKDDISPDEQAALQTAVGNYFATFWADIENMVDQNSFINWYVASEILGGYKQLSDIYVYKDFADGKLHFGPLWSNDKAYNNNANHPVDMSDLNTPGSYNGLLFSHADYKVMRNIIEALWQEQWFKDAVLAKWNTLYGEAKTTDLLASLTAKIDVLAAEIAQTQADNYAAKANGGAGWTLEGDYASSVQAIKDYLNQRFVYLDTKFKQLSANEVLATAELVHGEPYTITTNTTVDKVVYKRSFDSKRQNHYQVWYVPFDYTITGEENADFYGINMIAATDDPDGIVTDNTAVYIYIEKRTAGTKLKANMPYVIKPHQQDYEFVSQSEEGVILYAPTTESRLKMSTSAFEYNFYGTYDTFQATKGHDWLSLSTAGEICWNATQAAKLGSYCWYVKVTPNTSNPEYAKLFFAITEGSEEDMTNIVQTSNHTEVETYYTPEGFQLHRPTKGLNIIKMKDGTTRKLFLK